MGWFCSGYSPRRFILGIVRGLTVDRTKIFARVWKPRGNSWRWITSINTWGIASSYQKAMDEAEASIEDKLGVGS